MEIVTAVLSGNRCLELRVFATVEVALKLEQSLTRRLCMLIDRHGMLWRR